MVIDENEDYMDNLEEFHEMIFEARRGRSLVHMNEMVASPAAAAAAMTHYDDENEL